MKRFEIILCILIVLVIGIAAAFGDPPRYSFEPSTAAPAPAKKLEVRPGAAGGSVSKPTDHIPDATKLASPPIDLPENKLPAVASVKLLFHHSKTNCQACIPAAEFFRLYGKSLACPVEDHPYEDLERASEHVPFVPYLELVTAKGDVLERWQFLPKNGTHDGGTVCPGCINARIRAAREQAIEFDGPKNLVASKRSKVASIPYRLQVHEAFDLLRKVKLRTFKLVWHSDLGRRQYTVCGKNKSNLTLQSVCGTSGRVELYAPGIDLPLDSIAFAYRFYPNGKIGIDPDEMLFDLPGAPRAKVGVSVAGQQPVGFAPLAILSALTTVMNLLNTHADVTLDDVLVSGTFDDTKLIGNFDSGPEIKLQHLWPQYADVTQFELAEDRGVARTNGWWPIPKEQVFALTY